MNKNELINKIMDLYYTNQLNEVKINLRGGEWLYFAVTPFSEFVTLGKGKCNLYTFSSINTCINYIEKNY